MLDKQNGDYIMNINTDSVEAEISLPNRKENMFKIRIDETNWRIVQEELLSAGFRWIAGNNLKELDWIKGEGGVWKDIVIGKDTFILVGRGRNNNKMQVWRGNKYFDRFKVQEIIPNKNK